MKNIMKLITGVWYWFVIFPLEKVMDFAEWILPVDGRDATETSKIVLFWTVATIFGILVYQILKRL